MFPGEQRACRKKWRGTNDFLYIHRAVFKEVNSSKKNFPDPGINYKKSYDIMPSLFIITCLDMFEKATKTLLVNVMKDWRVILYAGDLELT